MVIILEKIFPLRTGLVLGAVPYTAERNDINFGCLLWGIGGFGFCFLLWQAYDLYFLFSQTKVTQAEKIESGKDNKCFSDTFETKRDFWASNECKTK